MRHIREARDYSPCYGQVQFDPRALNSLGNVAEVPSLLHLDKAHLHPMSLCVPDRFRFAGNFLPCGVKPTLFDMDPLMSSFFRRFRND
jgi:hypothetical protein